MLFMYVCLCILSFCVLSLFFECRCLTILCCVVFCILLVDVAFVCC